MSRPSWLTWRNAASLPLVLVLRVPVACVLNAAIVLGVCATAANDVLERRLPRLHR